MRRRGGGAAHRAFGPGEVRLGLVQAVAAFAVVGGRPGSPPERDFHRPQVERLGHVPGPHRHRVGAVGALRDGEVEDHRVAVGGEADLRGDPRRRGQVEDAEASGFAAGPAGLDLDRPDLGPVRAALTREALRVGGDARGAELERGAFAERFRVQEQPRRQVDLEVADVAVGERDAGLALEFAALPEAEVEVEPVGVVAGLRVGAAAVGDRDRAEPFFARQQPEACGGFEGGLGAARARGVGRREPEVVVRARRQAADRGPGGTRVGAGADRDRSGSSWPRRSRRPRSRRSSM